LLGGGHLNARGRNIWHSYMTDNFHFGDLPPSSPLPQDIGYVPNPHQVANIDWRYAISSFGLGVTVTPPELSAAYATLVNGGQYAPLHLIPRRVAPSFPITSRSLSTKTSETMVIALEAAYRRNNPTIAIPTGYKIGGKSGTAPVAGVDGIYTSHHDYGTYIGFITHHNETYILNVRLDSPETAGFASHEALSVWNGITAKLAKDNLL
jgi:cell division protein FtsI/penicillin-binding protein 2